MHFWSLFLFWSCPERLRLLALTPITLMVRRYYHPVANFPGFIPLCIYKYVLAWNALLLLILGYPMHDLNRMLEPQLRIYEKCTLRPLHYRGFCCHHKTDGCVPAYCKLLIMRIKKDFIFHFMNVYQCLILKIEQSSYWSH